MENSDNFYNSMVINFLGSDHCIFPVVLERRSDRVSKADGLVCKHINTTKK